MVQGGPQQVNEVLWEHPYPTYGPISSSASYKIETNNKTQIPGNILDCDTEKDEPPKNVRNTRFYRQMLVKISLIQTTFGYFVTKLVENSHD